MFDRRDPPQTMANATIEIARDAVRVRRFTLRGTGGVNAGAEFVSQGERMVVGTHQSADAVLSDPTVSRFHCELTVREGAVHIRDLGSRNGVFVDGVRVVEAVLRSGSQLALGETHLHLEMGDDTVDVSFSPRDRFGVMVGRSLAIRRVFSLLERAAQSQATVLLGGETGTGKEVAAESIHRESDRRDGPFIVVDCGAIPPDLLESELFGHERGSFTGAVGSRTGAFEAASGGTIFLDEIGELSADLQPKLLRVLERKEVKRVGSNHYVPADVRVVAATNRNLRAEVNARRFRSDLYYRLAVVEVTLPPLRERPEDLPMLLEHILASGGLDARPEAEIARRPEFMATLARHSWPGNVRELRNYVERCLALAEQGPLESDDGEAPEQNREPGLEVDVSRPLKEGRERWIAAFEKRYLAEILEQQSGNVAAAARAAGVDRIHFYRLLRRHGLRGQ